MSNEMPITGKVDWVNGVPVNFILNIAGPAGAFYLAEGQFEQMSVGTPGWHLPIGTQEFPPEAWYAATVHDLTGKLNGGYEHSGVDYNLDRPNWGDIDQGEPVMMITQGVVDGIGYSEKNLRCVVILVEHQGKPLYCRYWHLARAAQEHKLNLGQRVYGGDVLGVIGDYRKGDHLHFDMALDPIIPREAWLSPGIRWVDPVLVLKEHIDPGVVDASLRLGDG